MPSLQPPAPVRAAFNGRPARWLLAVCLVIGLALRVPGLNAGLWYDEIETLVAHVRHPLAEILTTFDSQNQHLLYSVLARLSVTLLGESPVALRLPAVLLGLASLWAFYRFARRVTPLDEAMLGTAALAVSYSHVWFSQNARGYTGLLLFALLGTQAFHRLLTEERVRWRDAVVYGLWMALAAYVHLSAAFVGVAHAAALGILLATSRGFRPAAGPGPLAGLALAALLGLVLYAPVLPQLAGTLLGPSPDQADTAWQSPLWLLAETVRGLSRGIPGGGVSLAVGAAVGLTGLASFYRQDRALAGLLVLPALITGLVLVGLAHNLWPRFFFFSAGFAVLIGVRGGFALATRVLRERGRLAATAAAIPVLLASAWTVPRAWGPKQDFRGAAEFVDHARAADDAVVTVDMTVYPYSRYLKRDWAPVTSLESLEAIEGHHPRTWVLYTFPVRLATVQPGIWARLATGYDTAAVYPGTVGSGAVVVMVRRSNSPAN